MENIQFQQMVCVCGTWYPQTCKFLKLKHHHVPLLQPDMLKIELNVSMITILVEMKEDVN
jgi:hypothetical protein